MPKSLARVSRKRLARSAKRTMLRTAIPNNAWRMLGATDIELRRWCVEQVIRWPTESYHNAVYSQGGGVRSDVDIIGRATKLLNWVTGVK